MRVPSERRPLVGYLRRAMAFFRGGRTFPIAAVTTHVDSAYRSSHEFSKRRPEINMIRSQSGHACPTSREQTSPDTPSMARLGCPSREGSDTPSTNPSPCGLLVALPAVEPAKLAA
jgi:hypothetical protein